MTGGAVGRRRAAILALAAVIAVALALALTVGHTGPPEADCPYEEACRAFDRGDFSAALYGFMPFAERGQAASQFFVAEALRLTPGRLNDPQRAAHWYRKAAEQGHRAAQCNLGVLYYKGLGVARDFDQARRWWTKAAEAGDPVAQFNLGTLYARGDGTARNSVLAYVWLAVAETNGMAKAHASRSIVRKSMAPAQLAAAKDIAEHMVPPGTPLE